MLDLDASVGPLPGELRIPLSDWQEALRFSCSLAHMERLRGWLDQRMPAPAAHGTVLTGSGDFHHLSWLLIERQLKQAPARRPLRVVVFDNHPDNMRFPFGVHCGSWMQRVAALPGVKHVHVVGITSADIGWAHCWENQLAPLRAGKLSYWSSGVNTGWARWLGVARAFRNFDNSQALVAALCEWLLATPQPTYLSIDKDVFSSAVVHTNWDQGQLSEAQINLAIAALRGQITGSDITGEVSVYRYRSAWKRWLSRIDAQDGAIDPAQLRAWQAEQHALSQRLIGRIAAAAACSGPVSA